MNVWLIGMGGGGGGGGQINKQKQNSKTDNRFNENYQKMNKKWTLMHFTRFTIPKQTWRK